MLISVQLLTSCDIDDKGDMHLTGFGWFLMVAVIVGFIVIMISANINEKNAKEKLAEKGLKIKDFVWLGIYAGGHPQLDKPIKGVSAIRKGENIVLYSQMLENYPDVKVIPDGSISMKKITDIKLEDATTIQRKITVGRMLLVGIFAFAWKKKKKNESAYITIYWNDGKFDQETTFMFEGKNSLEKANTARNSLMRMCTDMQI